MKTIKLLGIAVLIASSAHYVGAWAQEPIVLTREVIDKAIHNIINEKHHIHQDDLAIINLAIKNDLLEKSNFAELLDRIFSIIGDINGNGLFSVDMRADLNLVDLAIQHNLLEKSKGADRLLAALEQRQAQEIAQNIDDWRWTETAEMESYVEGRRLDLPFDPARLDKIYILNDALFRQFL